MKKIIIFGVTQFAEVLSHYIEQEGTYEIAAYTVNASYIPREGAVTFNKMYPVVAFEEIEDHYPPDQYSMFICVGYNRMNAVREQIFWQAKDKGYEILSYIHPTATVLTNGVGEGTIIMERAVIGPFVKMGVGNVFLACSHVAHHTTMGNFNFFTISVAVAGNVLIGSNCFFGNNCTIKNGIRIGNYTLIGAGCYSSQETKPYSVHVPARSVQLEGMSSLDMNLISG